ncbi:MAG: NTP transferase domain-containing protein [Dehalococcoidia bacterium]|nr:MAG: NTP transferase domain-containing protein [Dehalococcoidia bacterium]UCG84506.1 MAG: NTP transferase domain-containing protein [Dehalococcoidia bacterium]
MKAVILAAGEGKRMHPLTFTRPKVMLPIANKPIMEHLLVQMKEAGISDFIFVVGYHGETIREHFGDGHKWGVRTEYVTQRKQLGTAHAVKLVERLVGDRFILANGDIVAAISDIEKVMASKCITMSLVEAEDTRDLGVVEIDGDKVVGIYEKVEKPPSNLANTGIYLLTGDIFPAIDKTRESRRGEYELTDSLEMLIKEGQDLSWVKIDSWLDVSYPWDLLEANEALMTKVNAVNQGEVEENVVLKGTVAIGAGTVVRSNSYIVGPVVIGENCEIGPNCYIRPSTAIGDNCHVGGAVEVKNSIVMRNSKLPHHNYVGDSVIGEGCNFGAGTKIANLRLDHANITVADINTGRRKLGAIVGGGVQTGINASINVGSTIGDHSFIGPGAIANGVILPNSRIL